MSCLFSLLLCLLISGWTWGNCLAEASFSDRRWEMTALDSEGYLYILGGEEYVGNNSWSAVNDVWKSTFAIRADQRNKLQKACNIIWPQCTVGLSCWPGLSGTKIIYDTQGRAKVTCPLLTECYIPPSDDPGDGSLTGDYASSGNADLGSSTSSMATSTAAIIATFVILGVLVVGYCCYRNRQNSPDTSSLAIKLDTQGLLGSDTSSTNSDNLGISFTSLAQPV